MLMHLTSLPSPWGIGTMGQAARNFADFLAAAGQSYWQILPIGPTSYGDSPYQSFSTFAGNPYLIDLDDLAAEGLLERGEYEGIDWGEDPQGVDYGLLYEKRWPVLARAVERLLAHPPEDYPLFLAENATCLDMKIPPRTVILSVLPIHHAYCLSMDILKGISLGSVICINDSLLRVAKNIKLFQPNMILMVPLMIETMAKKLEEVSGLPAALVKRQVFGKQFHTICSGGAYLPPAMIDLFARYGITILQGYGMTECSPVISTTVSWNIRKESVGQLLPNCEAKTVDEELWVRGSSVMLGYYKMPEETAETLVDGWLRTGDLGYVDEDGFVYLTGRKKNLIITKNGENVSPEELENKIGENRLVQEILVREKEGVIEAEIYPDYEYAKKKHIKDIRAALQQLIDDYNQGAPAYKKVYSLKVRETEFEKNTSRKIKRY